MPDALTKSITVPGWGMLVKVRLATPHDSHLEGLLGPSSLGLAWEELLREVPMTANLPLPQKSGLKGSGLSKDLDGALAAPQHLLPNDMQDSD